MRGGGRDKGRTDGRPPGHTPSRFGADEPIIRVAPWHEWKRVALHASKGAGEYRVQFTVSGIDPEDDERYSSMISSAAHKHFKIEDPPREGEGPAAYLVGAAGRLRVVYDELIVRFEPLVPPVRCSAILKETGFRAIKQSCAVKGKWIVRHARAGVSGEPLLAAADAFDRFEEVRFAWPKSVAEYVRAGGVAEKAHRWWLDKTKVNWSTGSRRLPKGNSGIVIAVLDDGVDINHPNLVGRVATNLGRDYAVAVGQPGHDNPRPKVQVALPTESDYHGTQCAGVICSDGSEMSFVGVAPGCKLAAVRVIDGPELIDEDRLADAIVYATGVADVISCSWNGETHADVVDALNDTKQGRGDKGTVLVCAAGNDGANVDFPATHSRAIAVGACGPMDEVTDYSNTGARLDVVAPSSLHNTRVYSTDVSKQGWGYNTGTADDAGLFSDEFGKTSAATAVTAGVAALCLSVHPNLTAAQVRDVIRSTADKVGGNNTPPVVYVQGRSPEFGYGCINAAAAYQEAKKRLNQ